MMVARVQRSDLVAIRNDIDVLKAETRQLREKIASSWEQAMTRFGDPLYDSGWVLSAAGVHTFTHNLGELPTAITLMAADDGSGTNPVIMLMGRDGTYGFVEDDVTTTQLKVNLGADGYAYSSAAAKWYVRGTDYIRLLIWAIDAA